MFSLSSAWRQRLETWLHKLWFKGYQAPWPCRVVLLMGALLHRWVRHYRQLDRLISQAKRPFHARKLPLVLVVGNVVVGGAGKTPVVLAAVQHLQAQQLSVGIISRGFGRQNQQTCLIDPHNLHLHTHSSTADLAQKFGDEPLWLAQRTGSPVAVGANRTAALQCLLSHYPNLHCVVSDDGLQHHALQRDLEWLVFDERGAGNRLLLPQGPLREPLKRLHSADAVLASNIGLQALSNALHSPVGKHWHAVQVRIQGFMQHSHVGPGQKQAWLSPEQALQHWQGKTLAAFAGLGNPDKWFKALQALGFELPEDQTTALPDHFNYPENFCDAYSEDVLITTEKDAVKLTSNVRLWVAIVAVELPAPLLTTLDQALRHVR